MKFFTIFAVMAAAFTIAFGAIVDTNAARLARDLPALPAVAKRGHPTCESGEAECCASVVLAADASATVILGLLGIHVGLDVRVGLSCDPLGYDYRW
jgi:Fungal hydrophobin